MKYSGQARGFKLRNGRIKFDIRKTFFFSMRAVRHWYRLSRDAGEVPSPEVFKSSLDGGPGQFDLVWGCMVLSSFQPKPLCDTMVLWTSKLPLCPNRESCVTM